MTPSVIASLALGASTLLCLAGWRSATKRGDALQARYDEALELLAHAAPGARGGRG